MSDKKKKKNENMGIFNQQRYHEITLNDTRRTPAGHLSPATTDGLANHSEAVISFFHVPSESDIFFKAFVTTFVESYQSDWNSETVFGRTDPIYTFKNTQRHITLGWKIPADTESEAYENLAKVQKLARFLYPNYADLGQAGAVLSQSPLVRLKVMNLAAKSAGGFSLGEDSFMTPSFPYNAKSEVEFGDLSNPTYDEKIAARKSREAKRVEAEQDRINAEARGYDGMFGQARLKKDARQIGKIDKRNERRARKGKDPRARDVANREYFSSAIRGHAAAKAEAAGGEGAADGLPSMERADQIFDRYKSTNRPDQGLLGVITNVNINHNLENGDIGVIQPYRKKNVVLPKMIEVSVDFACIHESTLGWTG